MISHIRFSIYRYFELLSKSNIDLKTLLQEGLSKLEFYGNLVYKFRKLVCRTDFKEQLKRWLLT